MSFGRVIAEARKRAGLSQKELAASVLKEDGRPISPQYLNDIEHDRRNPPPEYLIERFAEVLGINADLLYYRAGELPRDVRGADADEERVVAAYKAFRQEIYG
jgi:transcriptional regulator with XRE-family HTH domain